MECLHGESFTLLQARRCTLDTYLCLLYFYMSFALIWIALGKIYVQSQLAWLKNSQFYTTDGIMMLLLPATYSFAKPGSLLHRATPNTQLIGYKAIGLLLGLWVSSTCLFYLMVGLGKGLALEPTRPSLNVRTVENPFPSWWSSLDMFKDDILFLGDMQSRADGMDASLVYVCCCMHTILVGLALAIGGRTFGTSDEVSQLRAEEEENARKRKKALKRAQKKDRQERDALMGSGVSSADPRSTSGAVAASQDPNEPLLSSRAGELGDESDSSSSSAAESGSERGSRAYYEQNPDRATARRMLAEGSVALENDSGWLQNPFKVWFFFNVAFVFIFTLFLIHFMVLMHMNGGSWNYTMGVNGSAVTAASSDLKDYFVNWHGTSRTMRNLEDVEITALSKGDAKRKLVLPTPEQFGKGKKGSTGECEAIAQRVLQQNAHEANLKSGTAQQGPTGEALDQHVFSPLKNSGSAWRQVGEGTCGVKFIKNRESKANMADAKVTESEAKDKNIKADQKQLTDTEQPHNFFQDLGFLGKSQPHADSLEARKRWCDYLCMNSWSYRWDF